MLQRILRLTFVLAACSMPLWAQEKPDEAATNLLTKTVDIDFPGGTVQEYIQTIEKQNQVRPNVILSSPTAKAPLPPIRLKSVTVSDAIQALGQLELAGKSYLDVGRRVSGVLTVGLVTTGRKEESRSVRVFSVKSLLDDGCRIEDIVTAIETVWRMRSEAKPSAMLKFHEETKLLIAVGIREEIMAVDNVLVALSTGRSKETQELVNKLAFMEGKLEELMKENAQLKAKLSKTTK